MIEKAFEFYQHIYDNNPINIVSIGESIWDNYTHVERNCSEFCAIELVLDGVGTFETNGKSYEVCKNDIFVLRKGSRHRYRSKRGSEWHKLYITFTGELCDVLINKYLGTDVDVFRNCDFEYLFRSIQDTARDESDNYSAMADDITPKLIRLLIEIRNNQLYANNDLADKIKDYLDARIDKPFNLDMLCNEFSYSKNHIINQFTKKYDVTPYQYYTNKKLDSVKVYVLSTGFSLAEISQKMSFSDQQYFSSWFKSLTGLSPTQYKKKYKNQPVV